MKVYRVELEMVIEVEDFDDPKDVVDFLIGDQTIEWVNISPVFEED